jgi:hypothetical protein
MKLIFLTIKLFYDMSDIPISWKKINCGLPKTGRFADDRSNRLQWLQQVQLFSLHCSSVCSHAQWSVDDILRIYGLGLISVINIFENFEALLPYDLVKKNLFIEVISQRKSLVTPCTWVQIHEFIIITYDWKWRILINMPARSTR